MRNSEEIAVRLLSVRSDALIVERLPIGYDDLPDSVAKKLPVIERIAIDSISRFTYIGVGTPQTIALSGLIGLFVGGAITGFSGYAQIYAPVGALLGIVVGSAISASGDDVYYLQNPEDLERISGFAVYREGEPDELKKIK